MKALLFGAAGIFSLVVPALAETQYDRSLEKAAIEIVANNIGTLRGGFSFKQVPQMVAGQEPAPRPAPRVAPADGLVPAVERPPASQLF